MKSRDPQAITDLNLWVLRQVFMSGDRAPARVKATNAPHIRRCIRFGFVRVEAGELVLTETGRAAVKETK